MDNMEWVGGDKESRLIRNQVEVGFVIQGDKASWWWWFHMVVDGQWGFAETQAEAKAAVEKEVGK